MAYVGVKGAVGYGDLLEMVVAAAINKAEWCGLPMWLCVAQAPQHKQNKSRGRKCPHHQHQPRLLQTTR
jgi:hypothetical protein